MKTVYAISAMTHILCLGAGFMLAKAVIGGQPAELTVSIVTVTLAVATASVGSMASKKIVMRSVGKQGSD